MRMRAKTVFITYDADWRLGADFVGSQVGFGIFVDVFLLPVFIRDVSI
ncbi:hypothetical protein RSSM_04247 [Rhodopirellula sallentina SM41]|uniref:Uncharacterized protein n=1 Tax=Rhodopirellula sallentina SM41 TaxID=1263870 RepID=M5U8Z6_9BACT|nr:hypothetical protein RSSM_04247 [Rhodopirellula sallentina SM41]